MKIAFVYQFMYQDSFGGGEKRLYEISRYLNEKNEITWFTQFFPRVFPADLDQSKHHAFSKEHIPSNHRSLVWTIKFCWQCLFKIPYKNFDIVHFGQMPTLHLFAVLIFYHCCLRFTKVKIVIDWWEFWGAHWNRFPFPVNWIGRLVENCILKMATNMVVISDKTKADIQNKTNAKLCLIHNGVDFQRIQNVVKNQPKKEYDFCFLGRIEKHKNPRLSLEVFEEYRKIHPDSRMIFIGSGAELENLQKLVTQKGLSDAVDFTGFVEKEEDLYRNLGKSKMMLFFATQEGGGSITLFEANAAGIPVVSANYPNGIDAGLLTNKNSLFYQSVDTKLIAQDLNTLLKDDVKYKKLSESACVYAQNFEWKKLAHQYEQFFHSL